MAMIDELNKSMIGEVYTSNEVDREMEKYKFYPVETECDDENYLEYSNNKSVFRVYYLADESDYMLIEKITNYNKKRGNTMVDPFFNDSDIKAMMDYFRDRGKNQEFMIFMLELLLARRIGDTVSLKWSDFYHENGNKKTVLNTLIEQKTDKIVDINISTVVWKYLDWYCEKMNINPMEHIHEDIFPRVAKTYAKSRAEYDKAVKSQAASFRREFKAAADFCGIENVSTHSLRKSFGYISHQVFQFDPDNMAVLQSIYGHSDQETTKRYIGIMREKAKKLFDTVGQRILDIDNDVKTVIKNLPVISLRTNDFRDLLLEAAKLGAKYGELNAESLNDLLDRAEEKRVA